MLAWTKHEESAATNVGGMAVSLRPDWERKKEGGIEMVRGKWQEAIVTSKAGRLSQGMAA